MIAKTKNERRQAYRKIIALMLEQEHEKALNELCAMCGSDTGLFIIADYKAAKAQQGSKGCEARQFSDQMICHKCGIGWDVNDTCPPACKGGAE